MKLSQRICILICLMSLASLAMAQGEQGQNMPPMGQPPEMKTLAYLPGDWDAIMKMKMSDTSTAWTEFKGTAHCTSLLDGCIYQTEFEADMGGMKIKGMSFIAFDRETGRWQNVWIDNMSARISIYEGERKNDTLTVVGKDLYMGKEYLSRIMIFNESSTSYEWKMESSLDGGKTFIPMGSAVYTKRP